MTYDLFLSLQIYTAKLLAFFNLGLFGMIVLCTSLLIKQSLRLTVVGWMCAIFSVCVFAAPLSIMVNFLHKNKLDYICFKYSINFTICYGFLLFYILSIVCVFQGLVIKTKSVEFMPFSLSFFLTICATMWFSYGLLIDDLVVAVKCLS